MIKTTITTLTILIILTGCVSSHVHVDRSHQHSKTMGSSIAFPWRAASHIVQHGGSFEILFQQNSTNAIDSIVLRGPYSNAKLIVNKVEEGNFIYDDHSNASTNRKITVTVPLGTPEDMYDIIITEGSETVTSLRSLKVVKEFKRKYTILHVSDTHVSRNWRGTETDGYAEELELMHPFVKLANIIGPDLVINTGDLIMDYTRFDPDETGWGGRQHKELHEPPFIDEKWSNYYDGAKGLSGLHDINAPTFSLPGNHDFYGVSTTDDKVKQWNEFNGKRAYGYSYGSTRFLAYDDFLTKNEDAPVLADYLKDAGPGDLRILTHHADGSAYKDFVKKHDVGLILYGHNHTPDEMKVEGIPALRPGSVTRTDWANWDKQGGFFRLIWVDGDKFTYSPPLRFTNEAKGIPYKQIESNLLLDYPTQTTATIENKWNTSLPNMLVRFVLPKGTYSASNGTIEQSFSNDTATIVDVRIDAPAKTKTEIKMTLK